MSKPLSLFFRKLGSGPALVICHGLFGSSMNWQNIAKRLSADYTVYSLDLRNHGKSEHQPHMDYPTMAADLGHFIDSQQLVDPILLGHSMGGKVVMTYVLQNPGRIKKLVVADIAPVKYGFRMHGDYIRALLSLDLKRLTRRDQADEYLMDKITDFSTRQFLLKNLVQNQDSFSWQCNLPVLQEAMEELMDFPKLEQIHPHKTLFLCGGNSDYMSRQYYPAVYGYFPQAQITLLPGTGHWLHAEQPEAFTRDLRDFLII